MRIMVRIIIYMVYQLVDTYYIIVFQISHNIIAMYVRNAIMLCIIIHYTVVGTRAAAARHRRSC
jgi:hypothetical protein